MQEASSESSVHDDFVQTCLEAYIEISFTIVHCFWLFILLTPLISYELGIIKLFAYFHYLVGVASSEYNFSFTKNDGDFFMLEKIKLGLHMI
jgi:hypothetical protein